MRKVVILGFAALLFAGGIATAAEGELWSENFKASQAKASKEGKDLLMDFTGSDWCAWCIKLNDEVFSKPAFQKSAQKNFVLVKVDFPHNKKLPLTTTLQNSKLMKRYFPGVQPGFPTVFLADSDGDVYARTGYKAGGPDAYVKHLDALRVEKAAFVKIKNQATAASGLERARLFDQLVNYQIQRGLPTNNKIYKEIVAADADGKGGFKEKYILKVMIKNIEEKFDAAIAKNDFPTAISVLDGAMTNQAFPALQRQTYVIMKAEIKLRLAKFDAAIQLLKAAQKLAPDSEISKQIPDFIKQTEVAKAEAEAGLGK